MLLVLDFLFDLISSCCGVFK